MVSHYQFRSVLTCSRYLSSIFLYGPVGFAMWMVWGQIEPDPTRSDQTIQDWPPRYQRIPLKLRILMLGPGPFPMLSDTWTPAIGGHSMLLMYLSMSLGLQVGSNFMSLGWKMDPSFFPGGWLVIKLKKWLKNGPKNDLRILHSSPRVSWIWRSPL